MLVLTNQLHVGGAETWVVAVSDWLNDHGAEVHVAATPGELVARLSPGVRYHPVPLKDLRTGIPLAAVRIRQLVRAHEPAVIVANSLVTAIVARLACAADPIPVFAVAHGWPAERYRLVARPLAVARRTIAVSDDVRRRLLRAGLAAHKVVTVPNGIDLRPFAPREEAERDRLRAAMGVDPHDVVVMNTGRHTEQKQQRHLIEVARRLRSELPELRWWIAGWGPLAPELARQVHDAGLEGIVHLLGRRDDVPDLLAAADLYVSSSDWEGMPLSMIEAMAAGLPVVTTAVEGIGDLVDGDNGATVPPGDVDGLTAQVRRLGRDEVLRLRLGKASRHRAEARHGLDTMCRRLVDVLQREVGS